MNYEVFVFGVSKGVGGENENLDNGDAKVGKNLSNTHRVYSDLGSRSNLMDLMSCPNGELRFVVEDEDKPKLESKERGSSCRFESSKFVGRNNFRSMVLGNGKDRLPSS